MFSRTGEHLHAASIRSSLVKVHARPSWAGAPSAPSEAPDPVFRTFRGRRAIHPTQEKRPDTTEPLDAQPHLVLALTAPSPSWHYTPLGACGEDTRRSIDGAKSLVKRIPRGEKQETGGESTGKPTLWIHLHAASSPKGPVSPCRASDGTVAGLEPPTARQGREQPCSLSPPSIFLYTRARPCSSISTTTPRPSPGIAR